jgi:hypothetical protein
LEHCGKRNLPMDANFLTISRDLCFQRPTTGPPMAVVSHAPALIFLEAKVGPNHLAAHPAMFFQKDARERPLRIVVTVATIRGEHFVPQRDFLGRRNTGACSG